jgi:hypothetical protein
MINRDLKTSYKTFQSLSLSATVNELRARWAQFRTDRINSENDTGRESVGEKLRWKILSEVFHKTARVLVQKESNEDVMRQKATSIH